jgi:hypothetical protein
MAKGEAERSAPYAPHIHAQCVAYLLSSLDPATNFYFLVLEKSRTTSFADFLCLMRE